MCLMFHRGGQAGVQCVECCTEGGKQVSNVFNVPHIGVKKLSNVFNVPHIGVKRCLMCLMFHTSGQTVV